MISKQFYCIIYYLCIYVKQIIAARLDEMISDDKKQLPHILSCIADENWQRQLQTEDEEEDFLDESNNKHYLILIPSFPL